MKPLLIVALLCCVGAEAVAQRLQRVTVFVRADDSSGFVEPDLLDSVKDIQGEIRRRRNLRLASSVDDAALVLVVTARFVSDGERTSITLPGTATTTATQIGSTVTATTTVAPPVVLSLGTYVVESTMYIKPNETIAGMFVAASEGKEAPQFKSRPVIGTAPGGGWRYIAKAMTIDIERWVAANHEALK